MKIRIRKTDIEIRFWFFGVTTLLLTLLPESEAAYCFVFCILHELGHLITMFIYGKKADGIRLDYFGIKIIAENKIISPFKESAIAFGGPATNIFLAAFLFILKKDNLAVTNLALAFFNLLPVSILDGGHIISALFPESKAIIFIDYFIIATLLLTGGTIAIYSQKNFTLLIVSLYLLLGTMCKKD